jgi:hypothetical protein
VSWDRQISCAALALVVAGSPLPAAAQAAPVPILLEGDRPSLDMTLSLGAERSPLVRCLGTCGVLVPPGTYFLSVRGPGVIEGGREIDVEWQSTVRVHPRTEAGRSTGLALGIVGIALIGAGSALALAMESGGDTSEGSITLLGVGAVVTGLVLTPIGWVQFARTSPHVEVVTRDGHP